MFKVECKYDHKDLYLSITHNGYHWTSIAIKKPEHEIPLIIEALARHLSEASTGPDKSDACYICGKTAGDVEACPFCDCVAINEMGHCEGCGKLTKPPPA